MRTESLFFTFFLIAIVLIIFILTLNYDAKTRLMPLVTVIPTMILGIAVLVGELFPRFKKMFEVDLFKIMSISNEREVKAKWSEKIGFFIIFSWLILFTMLIFVTGFLVAVPVCVFLYIKFPGNISWTKSLIATAALWIFIYVVFQILMGLQLFQGVLFDAIV
ncbi:tripartite tricarboxylate transporter TctB family protein [Thermodesulfobacteriota bacterium]